MQARLLLIALILATCHMPLFAQKKQSAAEKARTAVKADTTIHPQDSSAAELPRVVYQNQDTTIRKLLDSIQKVSDNERQNSTAIQGLMQGKQIDNRTKYELLKNNLINSSETYYYLNKKIIDLKSRTTTNNLDVFISSLNNPESKMLGFSFSERILDMVKTIVLEGKADRNDRNVKIVDATNSIINSPIFKSLTALTPPLGIANSVMTFFHSVSVNNKAINEKNLKKFEQELNKYVVYYTALNEGNQKFQYGLNFNKDQLNLLHQNMFDHLQFTASALGMALPKKADNKPLGVVLNEYFIQFNKESAEKFFAELEKKYTIPGTSKLDYEKLLRENMSLKEANNQLEDLVLQTKRFENLYNEYFTLLDTYYDKVNSALTIAQDNGLADKNIVKQKQDEFRSLKDEAVTDIRASINISELQHNTDNIKYRYKIF
ncbi:hypothetical protein [Compostibacter hankyongensis]|uniref:TolC family protein n=1 Tax=Compostibacter hankyongensis TaxID=1007089 RepID=A0ABP8FIY6_9BACT